MQARVTLLRQEATAAPQPSCWWVLARNGRLQRQGHLQSCMHAPCRLEQNLAHELGDTMDEVSGAWAGQAFPLCVCATVCVCVCVRWAAGLLGACTSLPHHTHVCRACSTQAVAHSACSGRPHTHTTDTPPRHTAALPHTTLLHATFHAGIRGVQHAAGPAAADGGRPAAAAAGEGGGGCGRGGDALRAA